MPVRGTDRSLRRRLGLGGLLAAGGRYGMGGGLMEMLIAGSGVEQGFSVRLVVNTGLLFGTLVRGGRLIAVDVVGVGGGGKVFEQRRVCVSGADSVAGS
jgi:hypothetical protein